jgi:class 3 adenylate cyclase
MSSSGNRNFICTVVFIDIVGFSKKAVADQLRIKQQLNQLLATALQPVPPKDRIILDTGDGAAVSFLGDPEDGLFLGLALRDALAADDNTLQLRTGINLGPVRLVKDINNQPNIIGDGINVAQRVMDFAAPNQVLSSRSYYEVISALSTEHAKLFKFEGSRTDKHVREHEIYALGNAPAPQRAPRMKTAHAAAFEKLGNTASTARSGLLRRPWLTTVLTVILILSTAVLIRTTIRNPALVDDTAAVVEEPAVPLRKSPGAQPAPAAEVKPPAAPAKTKTKPESTAKAKAAKKTEPATTRETAAGSNTGHVRLNVLPWGEVYVNDRKFGVAPPLRDIALKPGAHRIEIRNPGFASYVQFIDLDAGEEIKIVHRFR